MTRTRRNEWYVEIDHPNGNTAIPEVVGQPTRKPRVNGLPGIRIPVEQSDKWDDTVWEEQPMRVWFRGIRQNIEQLERIEQTESKTELVGRGGIELRNIVDTEYTSEESTVVANDIISNNTSYTPNVDSIDASTSTNQLFDSRDTTSEFANLIRKLPKDEPFYAEGDELRVAQTCWVEEIENMGSFDGSVSRSDFSGGSGAIHGGSGGTLGADGTFTFTPDYTLRGENVRMVIRWQAIDENTDGGISLPAIEFDINNEPVFETTDPFSLSEDLEWFSAVFEIEQDLPAGEQVDVRIANTGGADDDRIEMDVCAVYDSRYNYFFDNDNGGSSGYLDGPELYPDAQSVVTDAINPAEAISGLRLEGTFTDTSNGQQIELSNDNGTTYNSASNTSTFETDFGNLGTVARIRFTLDRYGSRSSATPQTGYLGQAVQQYDLKGDLKPVPFVINQTLNDRVSDVLNTVANTGDFVWEFQIDNDGNKSVEFTSDGQRDVQTNIPISDYSVKKDVSKVVDKIILYGGTLNVTRETILGDHGTAVTLGNAYLKEGSETVADPNSDTIYERGRDYTINYKDGDITALASGTINDTQELDVSYSYKVRAVADNNVTNPRTEVVQFPEVTTTELAGLVAGRILNEVEVVDETVDITVSSEVEEFSPIDAINVDDIPQDKNFQIKTVEGTPDQIVVRAGNRESLTSVTEEIRSQLRTVSRKA